MNQEVVALPVVAKLKPYYAELEVGKKYFWCACGLSKTQPYCDGSHRGTDFLPVKVVGESDGQEVLFCGCKHSATAPFCDGSHNNLSDSYPEEDPNSEENRRVPIVETGDDGRAMLDGGCFVARMDRLNARTRGTLRYAPIIAQSHGAIYQTQFHFQAQPGVTAAISFGRSDTVIFFRSGQGQLNIGGQLFAIEPCSGAYVQGGEDFQITVTGEEAAECYVSACPVVDNPTFKDHVAPRFDKSQANRVVLLSEENRVPMGDRFFQLLVSEDTGSLGATQFIGEIPKSKAVRHRHLYEESLVLVTGRGMMWTENGKTPVEVGDVIFLPRKQEHSLECIVDEGMIVAGVIHPGDNPAINY